MVAVRGIVKKCLVTDSTVPDPVHTLLKTRKLSSLENTWKGTLYFLQFCLNPD